MQKILFHLNSLGKGGAERVVSLLASEFAADEYQVVIATEWQDKEEYPIHEKIKRLHVGLAKEEETKSRIRKQFIRISKLRKAILTEKPDLIIAFCAKANYRAMMAKTGLSIPVIVSVRNNPKVDYVGLGNKICTKLLLNRADGCVFQTEEAKSFFDTVLQKKSKIICNPVNEKYLQAERKPAEKKIVTVGRLMKQKNQMLLIKAFEKLLQKYPSYGLYLYGDGSLDEYKKELLNYVEKSEFLKEKVHFCGLSSTLDKDLADAAMFVLPSNYEGMPNALMEAMALGLPVISTDCPCGGSRYWIQDQENGLLTPVGEEEALLEAMTYLIEHPEKAEKMGQKAKESLKEATLSKVYGQWKAYVNYYISE